VFVGCEAKDTVRLRAETLAERSAGRKKPPAGHKPPEGVSIPAPPECYPTRRADEQGGAPIVALLLQGQLSHGSCDHEAQALHADCSPVSMSYSRRVVQRQEISSPFLITFS
jgi:hypothetical protein